MRYLEKYLNDKNVKVINRCLKKCGIVVSCNPKCLYIKINVPIRNNENSDDLLNNSKIFIYKF